MELARFKEKPLLGIVRGVSLDEIEPLIETVVSAGLETIEITMNTPRATDVIRAAVTAGRGRITIGAGTVLTMDDLRGALGAGASFIVMPVLIEEVVKYCVDHRIPVFPGALTPSEIYAAWKAGASMVKVFPAKFFGPEYFSEIKGPFQDIELLACAGVTTQNMKDYFSHGASAVSFGASVFRKEWLKARDFKSIADSVAAYVRNLSDRQ